MLIFFYESVFVFLFLFTYWVGLSCALSRPEGSVPHDVYMCNSCALTIHEYESLSLDVQSDAIRGETTMSALCSPWLRLLNPLSSRTMPPLSPLVSGLTLGCPASLPFSPPPCLFVFSLAKKRLAPEDAEAQPATTPYRSRGENHTLLPRGSPFSSKPFSS